MIIPLGAVGERVRLPVITLALIALNALVHVATTSRVAADERRLAPSAVALYEQQAAIELRRRGGGAVVLTWVGLGARGTSSSRHFWWRYEQGFIVPKDSQEWASWDAARREFDRERRTTLHYRLGFRRDEPTLLGLLCHGFLHGNFGHLFFNMLFLWAVGASVEDSWGRKWFALLYATGLVASAASDFAFVPAGRDIPGIGASGAVAAVMGAMAVRHFRRPMRIWSVLPMPGIYRVATGWLLVPWFFKELSSLASPDAAESGIGFGAHVAGFAVGAALAGALRVFGVEAKELEPGRDAERRRAARLRHEEAAEALMKRGRAPEALDDLRLALAEEPDDAALRRRIVDALGLLGRREEQRAEAVELLHRDWRAGERERFALAWQHLDAACGPLPAALAHRAAPLIEARDPPAAAAAYARAITEAPDDPLATASLKRYAELLERHGEPEKAAQVRAYREAHERRRRDATLR